jgi:hypothetical protein
VLAYLPNNRYFSPIVSQAGSYTQPVLLHQLATPRWSAANYSKIRSFSPLWREDLAKALIILRDVIESLNVTVTSGFSYIFLGSYFEFNLIFDIV